MSFYASVLSPKISRLNFLNKKVKQRKTLIPIYSKVGKRSLKSPAEQTPNYPFFSVSSRSNFGIAVYITLANNFDNENDRRHYAIAYGFWEKEYWNFWRRTGGPKICRKFSYSKILKKWTVFLFRKQRFSLSISWKPAN